MQRPRLLPPLLRAIQGFFSPRAVLEDELPPHRRPSVRAITENHGRTTALPREITVLSYNVKRAERWNLVTSTLRHVIEEHRPDFLLLQEAPLELARSSSLEPLIDGQSLFYAPFHQVILPDRHYPYPQYGQLIASGVQWIAEEVIELPTVNPSTLGRGHLMKRIALYVELQTSDERSLGLVNVHMEPFARRRLRQQQHEALLGAVNRHKVDITILCGDFNPSISQRGEPGLQLLTHHGFVNARGHRWRVLDTCLARGHQTFRRAASLPLPGSDHRPLLVTIRI
jgi:endonuclease/exonuclease/phosphatase family metal-dependent hydrolase